MGYVWKCVGNAEKYVELFHINVEISLFNNAFTDKKA